MSGSTAYAPLPSPPAPTVRHVAPPIVERATGLGSGAADHLVVRFRADDDEGRRRLTHQAAVLDTARNPGVAEVVAHLDDELVVAWRGGHTLATFPVASVAAAGRLMAMLAATVADLHELGVVHGRITADHVVIDQAEAPVLVGFGEATLARLDLVPHDPAVDVAALGALLRQLLDRQPSRPRAHSSLRSRREARLRQALMAVAVQASTPERWARPTARRLAHTLADLVPEARTARPTGPVDPRLDPAVAAPAPPTGDPAPPAGSPPRVQPVQPAQPVEPAQPIQPAQAVWHGRRVRRVLLAVLAVALVVAGERATQAALARLDARAAEAAPVADSPTDSEAQTGVDAAGRIVAAEPVPVITTGTIVREGLRYSIGQPGDDLIVGDLRCRGHDSVAVLRPSTGQLFVLDRWAEAGASESAPVTAAHPPGSRLTAVRRGIGECLDLVIHPPDGPAVVSPLEPAPSSSPVPSPVPAKVPS